LLATREQRKRDREQAGANSGRGGHHGKNIQHPTSNVQHPIWESAIVRTPATLEVGCWALDVECSAFPLMPDPIASASELTVRYGPYLVLDRATIAIGEGERVGLVGRNGSGKSTFLRIAAGELEPDSGQFTRPRDLITGHLPQVFTLDDN